MAELVHYDWPGHVRELPNVIERAVILSSNGVRCPQVPARSLSVRGSSTVSPRSATLDDVLRAHSGRAAQHQRGAGGPHGAAARLGMKRTTPASRMAQLGILHQRGTTSR